MCLARSAAALSCAGAGTAARTMRTTAAKSRSATVAARDWILFQLGIELQGQLQIGRLVPRKRHGIDPRVAGRAVLRTAAFHAGGQPLEAEVRHAVGVEVLANFFQRVCRGDEL